MEANKEYLEITAAKDAGGKHRVAGLAYSGGKMRLFGWSKPVVVDLSGMTCPFDGMTGELTRLGEKLGLEIRMQRNEIFDAMHRL